MVVFNSFPVQYCGGEILFQMGTIICALLSIIYYTCWTVGSVKSLTPHWCLDIQMSRLYTSIWSGDIW